MYINDLYKKIMTTVINNPSNTEDASSSLVIGIILTIVVLGGIALFFIYGLPMMQDNTKQNADGTTINVTLPVTTTSSAPAPTK